MCDPAGALVLSTLRDEQSPAPPVSDVADEVFAEADELESKVSHTAMAGESTPLLGCGTPAEKPVARGGGQGGLLSATFNLTNAVVGAGVLGFPSAYMEAGFVAGVVLTVFVVLLALCAHAILVSTARLCCDRAFLRWERRRRHRAPGTPRTPPSLARSYQELVEQALGHWAGYVCQLVLLLYLYGASVTYLTVLGDVAAPTVQYLLGEGHWYTDRRLIIVVLAILFVLPVCLPPQIRFLGFTSFLAVFAMVYVVSAVTIYALSHQAAPNLVWGLRTSYDFVLAIPVIAFSFQSHVVVIPVFSELKNPKVSRIMAAAGTGLAACVLLYSVNGFFGYLAFGDDTEGDILLNFGANYIAFDVGRLAVGLTVMFTIPLNNFAARLVLYSLAPAWIQMLPPFIRHRLPAFAGTRLGAVVKILASTLCFLGPCVVLSLFVPGISLLFEFIGSTMVVAVIFLFPGAMLFVARPRPWWRVFSAAFFITGVVLGTLGTVLTFLKHF